MLTLVIMNDVFDIIGAHNLLETNWDLCQETLAL